MSQDRPMPQNAIAARRQVPIRVSGKRIAVLNVIGLPELIGLAGAALLALITIFAYFYFYLPASSRLTSTELDRARLITLRQSSGKALEGNLSTQEQVNRIKASLVNFEGNWLPSQDSGRMALYTVLNKLMKSNGLRNTAGPTYAPLAAIGTKTQVQASVTAEKQSQAKWQTIYPGIIVSVTVEGPYQNVRHFVHDIEASHQFLIINAVELESVTQSGAAADVVSGELPLRSTGPAVNKPIEGSKRTLVSLRLDMSTYFQRADLKQTEQ